MRRLALRSALSDEVGTGAAVFESGAPTLTVTNFTGSLDLGAGTLSGAVVVNTVTATTDSPAVGEMDGHWHICTNAAGCDITLPSAVAGMSGCWYDQNGGGVVTLDSAAGDIFYLDGVALDAADAIDSAGTIGDFICILAIDATDWLTLGRSGTWIDGGTD